MAEVARDGIDLLLRSRWRPNREVIKRRSLEALVVSILVSRT